MSTTERPVAPQGGGTPAEVGVGGVLSKSCRGGSMWHVASCDFSSISPSVLDTINSNISVVPFALRKSSEFFLDPASFPQFPKWSLLLVFFLGYLYGDVINVLIFTLFTLVLLRLDGGIFQNFSICPTATEKVNTLTEEPR